MTWELFAILVLAAIGVFQTYSIVRHKLALQHVIAANDRMAGGLDILLDGIRRTASKMEKAYPDAYSMLMNDLDITQARLVQYRKKL